MDLSFAMRMIGAFAVIAAVLFGLQFVARMNLRTRLGSTAGGRRLVTVVETTHLPNASSLHVVKIGDEYAVIGRSANFIAKVADVPEPAVAAWLAAQPGPPPGAERLGALIARVTKRPQTP